MSRDMSDNISTSFKSLSHPIRVQILLILAEQANNGCQFTDISRDLQIESSSKLSFHLEKLSDLIYQDQEGRYYLNKKGNTAIDAIRMLGVEGTDREQISHQVSNNTVTVKTMEERVDETGFQRPSPGFPLTFGVGLIFQLFVGIGIPMIFAVIISAVVDNSSLGLMVFALMSSLLTIANGSLLYYLARKNQDNGAFNDLQLILLAISSLYAFFLSRLLIGGGSLLIFLLPYLLLSLGIYLAAQVSSSAQWENSLLVPRMITGSKPVLFGLGLIFLATLPLYQTQIYTEKLYATSNGEPFVYQSSQVGISSAMIGFQGLFGFTSIFLLISMALFIPKIKKYATSWIIAGCFILLSVSQFVLSLPNAEYEAAINIDAFDGWSWVLIDALGVVFYGIGVVTAILAHRNFLSIRE